jgi:hypothetical protein
MREAQFPCFTSAFTCCTSALHADAYSASSWQAEYTGGDALALRETQCTLLALLVQQYTN